MFHIFFFHFEGKLLILMFFCNFEAKVLIRIDETVEEKKIFFNKRKI